MLLLLMAACRASAEPDVVSGTTGIVVGPVEDEGDLAFTFRQPPPFEDVYHLDREVLLASLPRTCCADTLAALAALNATPTPGGSLRGLKAATDTFAVAANRDDVVALSERDPLAAMLRLTLADTILGINTMYGEHPSYAPLATTGDALAIAHRGTSVGAYAAGCAMLARLQDVYAHGGEVAPIVAAAERMLNEPSSSLYGASLVGTLLDQVLFPEAVVTAARNRALAALAAGEADGWAGLYAFAWERLEVGADAEALTLLDTIPVSRQVPRVDEALRGALARRGLRTRGYAGSLDSYVAMGPCADAAAPGRGVATCTTAACTWAWTPDRSFDPAPIDPSWACFEDRLAQLAGVLGAGSHTIVVTVHQPATRRAP